jgi:hypothetical protein
MRDSLEVSARASGMSSEQRSGQLLFKRRTSLRSPRNDDYHDHHCDHFELSANEVNTSEQKFSKFRIRFRAKMAWLAEPPSARKKKNPRGITDPGIL